MNNRDSYLRRAVRGAIAMLDDTPERDSVLAYHFAVGLAMQPEGTVARAIPQIIKDGIWALHHTANTMASEGEILLEDYANQQITAALVACEAGIRLIPGGAPVA